MTEEFSKTYDRRTLKPGESIFLQGDLGDTAYLIEHGKVEISSQYLGQKKTLSTLGVGELFGEMALIDNQKRSATATALEDTRLISLNRNLFKKKIDSADPVLHLLLRVILKRFRHTLKDKVDATKLMQTGEFVASGQTIVFDQAQSEALVQIQLESDLQAAMLEKQFVLHYQPILNTTTYKIEGFEALIRWNHPTNGWISPADFIEAAENSDLIIPIGDWVIEQACSDLLKLQDKHGSEGAPLWMSVNVSPRQIQYLARDNRLSQMIKKSGAKPGALKIEITENALIESPEVIGAALSEIKSQGIALAIDDFGTGYSSLSYLHRFSMDVLKIDRSFIDDLTSNSMSRRIVRAITSLAKELEMTVIAEGIETRQALEELQAIGCDNMQGYLASRPVPIGDALIMVENKLDLITSQTAIESIHSYRTSA